MRRKFLPYILTLSTVFMLALSILYIPLVLGQDKSEIIEDLEDLYDYVSELPNDAFEHLNPHAVEGKQKAFGNKIKAVIHKIESGAYQGAINKLTNDMKGKAEKWLVPPWENELKDLIQEIIDKIKGIVPPKPPTPDFDITASPDFLTIEIDGSATSIITITSLNNFSEEVDLTVSGVPSDVTATFDPEQVTPPANGEATSILTVSVGASATPDVYTLTITGTSNPLQQAAQILRSK